MQILQRPARGHRWYLRVQVRGRDRWLSLHTTNKQEAHRRAPALLRQLEAEAYGYSREVPTVDAWADEYLTTYTPLKVDGTNDTRALAALRARLGHCRLDAVTVQMAQRHLTACLRDRAESTVANERSILRAVWNAAIKSKVVRENPWVETARLREGRRVRVLSPEDQAALWVVATPALQRWLTVMLGTGLRVGEIRHLQPAWLDRERQLLRLPAKTAAGVRVTKGARARVVPVFPEVLAALEAQWATGASWATARNANAAWLRRACLRAGITPITPHVLRHTFATRYIAAGGDVARLSHILGHTSVVITMRYYVHLTDEMLVDGSLRLSLGLPRADPSQSRSQPPATPPSA